MDGDALFTSNGMGFHHTTGKLPHEAIGYSEIALIPRHVTDPALTIYIYLRVACMEQMELGGKKVKRCSKTSSTRRISSS